MKLSTFFHPIVLRNDVRAKLVEYFSTYLNQDMKVFDVGCGSKPFEKILGGKVGEYIGVDIEEGFYDPRHIDLVGSAYDVPAADATADAVISCQVIEHLEKPLDALKEAHRILKPGGLLFLSFPFLYPIHAAPHDHLRFTEFYMEQALQENHFKVLEKNTIGGFWYCAGVFADIYFRSFDRGVLKWLGITRFLSWLFRWGLRIFHEMEGAGLRLIGKNKDNFRKMWAVNYVLVVRKIIPKNS